MKKLLSLFITACLVANAFAQNYNPNALFPFPDASGEWGYIDGQKNVKIAYQFLGASPFYEERAFVARKIADKPEHVISVIDTKGKVLFDVDFVGHSPHELCQMDYFRYSDGLLPVPNYDDEKPRRYIDKMGRTKLELYRKGSNTMQHHQFSEGLACVQINDSTVMYINTTGSKVLETKGGMAPLDTEFRSGWVVSGTGMGFGDYTYLNKKGEKASFLNKIKGIQDLGAMAEGIAFIALNNPNPDNQEPICMLLQPDGSTTNIAIKLGYSSPVTTVTGYHFAEGLALVNQADDLNLVGGKLVYLNRQGEIAFQLPKNLHTQDLPVLGKNFHQGLACWLVYVGENSYKIVYITPTGKVAFESSILKVK